MQRSMYGNGRELTLLTFGWRPVWSLSTQSPWPPVGYHPGGTRPPKTLRHFRNHRECSISPSEGTVPTKREAILPASTTSTWPPAASTAT